MGLGLAEPGFHTRCFVEIEEYPQQALIAAQRAGYFAPAPIWTDLKTFDGRPWRGRIDTVLAGYPCQPFSAAGQRRGADDPRHLWPDVARIIREIEPEWVFLENVAGHVSLGLEQVLRELWGMGFTPAAGLFTAAETGTTHERRRIFIVAHGPRERAGEPHDAQRAEPWQRAWACSGGSRGRPDGARELADAGGARPQRRERAGTPDERDRPTASESTAQCRRPCLHPPGPADRDGWATVLRLAPDSAPAVSRSDIKAAALRFAAMVDAIEARAAEPGAGGVAGGEIPAALGGEAESVVDYAATESGFRRMADGMAARPRALRLLGNGVHPLAAAHAWRALAAAHGLGPVDLATASTGRASADATIPDLMEAP